MGTLTANGIYKPSSGENGWGDLVNTNFTALDGLLDNITSTGGLVGIGGTPTGLLTLIKTTTSQTANASANELIIDHTNSTGMSILTSNTTQSNIYFGDTDNNSIGRLRYDHNGDFMAFYTSTLERVRIDSTGNLGIGVSAFGTSATNVIGIKADGTVPSTSPAGMIQIYADDSSGGATNATLAFRTEETVVSEVLACDSTLNVWVNGVEYHLLMSAV